MIDKTCTQQVLGSLIKDSSILDQVDKYRLTPLDFSSTFERVIFTAISGLHAQGARSIGIVDIENYIEANGISKKIFNDNNGIEYLQDIEELTDPENFPYYYAKLKKINLLRDLKKEGFDTSQFYQEDLTKPDAISINRDFEDLSSQDIINNLKQKLLSAERSYLQNDMTDTESAAYQLDELFEDMENASDIGLPLQGKIFNEVVSGARRGALYIRSGSSGISKTRQAVGDACFLAYPVRYNTAQKAWEGTGSCEKVLFVATEQSRPEIQRMILAYLTGINESRFRFGHFTPDETVVINQAIMVMEQFEENFFIERMPNPSIELIKSTVRENVLLHDIGYVFYDYIFIGPSLLSEFKGFALRNDEVLLMFATALKDLAVELDIFVMTSTQVNANSDNNTNIRNESTLAGGRSTINKADVGLVMARPTKEEIDLLSNSTLGQIYSMPNIVTDVYKVRSGQWTQVRIWSYVDLGTLRKEDLFVTDSRLEPVQGFVIHSVFEANNWEGEDTEKIIKLIGRLNHDRL